MLQHSSSVLSVLEQGSHIQDVIQVGLDLYLELLALCLLQTLQVLIEPEVSELVL